MNLKNVWQPKHELFVCLFPVAVVLSTSARSPLGKIALVLTYLWDTISPPGHRLYPISAVLQFLHFLFLSVVHCWLAGCQLVWWQMEAKAMWIFREENMVFGKYCIILAGMHLCVKCGLNLQHLYGWKLVEIYCAYHYHEDSGQSCSKLFYNGRWKNWFVSSK